MATGRLNLVEAKGDGPSRGTRIGVAVDDIDAGHARAVAAGAEVIHPPRAEPWGSTSRYRDPDGNIVILTQANEALLKGVSVRR
jgi:predicted enzyme related to lactoylglutathione lyase